MDDINDFIKRMYEAFLHAEKPCLSEMTPHRCKECDEIRDKFHPYDKQSLPGELVGNYGDALPLLSPKALRYYFPRFIEYGLFNQNRIVFDNCLFHLAPEINDDEQYWKERINIFQSKEKEILREYLLIRRTMDDSGFDEPYIAMGLKIWS